MVNCDMLRKCFSNRKLHWAFLQQHSDTVLSILDTSGSSSGVLCWVVHQQLQASLPGEVAENGARITLFFKSDLTTI